MILKYVLKNEKHVLDPALLFRAIGNPAKKTIIEILAHNEPNVAFIQQLLKLSYQGVYQHLRELEEVGLITSYKVEKEKFYVLNKDAITALQS